MALTVTESNNSKIYNLTVGRSINDLLKLHKKNEKKVKKDI